MKASGRGVWLFVAVLVVAAGGVRCSTLLGIHAPPLPDGFADVPPIPKTDGPVCVFDDDASAFDEACGFGDP